MKLKLLYPILIALLIIGCQDDDLPQPIQPVQNIPAVKRLVAYEEFDSTSMKVYETFKFVYSGDKLIKVFWSDSAYEKVDTTGFADYNFEYTGDLITSQIVYSDQKHYATITYVYDSLNRIVETKSIPGSEFPNPIQYYHYEYDSLNRVHKYSHQRNTTNFTIYEYANASSQVPSKTIHNYNGRTSDINYTFDGKTGLPVLLGVNKIVLNYIYDLEPVYEENLIHESLNNQTKYSYTYDDLGNPLTMKGGWSDLRTYRYE